MIATIEAVSKKDKGPSSARIGDTWYKFWAYGKTPCKNYKLIEKGAKLNLVTEEKDEGQYGVVKYIVGAESATSSAPSARASATTPDSDKQAMIVAQSSLKAAVEALGPGKTLGDYKKMATAFADFCFNYRPTFEGKALAEEVAEVVSDAFDPFED